MGEGECSHLQEEFEIADICKAGLIEHTDSLGQSLFITSFDEHSSWDLYQKKGQVGDSVQG